MPVREQDHYQLLGLEPQATQVEIEQAIGDARRRSGADSARRIRLEQAYFVLTDPRRRQRYDQGIGRPGLLARELGRLRAGLARLPLLARLPVAATAPADPERYRSRRRLVLALAAVLVVVGGWACWQALGWRLTTFAAGTELVYRHSGRPFATVLGHDSGHRFPGGQAHGAYRVRLVSGAERWLSQEEVFRLARPGSGATLASGARP